MFFHLGEVEAHALVLLVIAVPSLILWFTWRKGSWTRVVGAITTIPLSALGILVFGLFLLSDFGGCSGHGPPIYSPNGKSAVLVWFHDEGATGGGTYVDVYQSHGLRYASVFDGGWKSVEQGDVQWIDGTHLTLHYEHWNGYDEQKTCRDLNSVKVTCIPK
jgi:hypothetical protein